MEEMFKEKMLYKVWTSQVYGHHDIMARTKTHRTSQNTEYTKTQHTLRNNYFFKFFGHFCFFYFQFSITQRNSPKNVELPPWYGQ